MSGPTRLNLADAPSKVPWPISTTSNVSSAVSFGFSEASVRVTFSRVADSPPTPFSDSTVTRPSPKPNPFRSVDSSESVHAFWLSANFGLPDTPDTMRAKRSSAVLTAGTANSSNKTRTTRDHCTTFSSRSCARG